MQNQNLYALLARALHIGSQLLTVVFLPLVLLPEKYVEYNLIIPAALILSSWLVGWVNGALFRWVHRFLNSKNLQQHVSWFYSLFICLMLFLSLLLYLYSIEGYYYLAPLIVLVLSLKDLAAKVLNASQMYWKYLQAYICFFTAKILYIYVLWHYGIVNIDTILILFVLTELIFLLPLFGSVNISLKSKCKLNFKYYAVMAGYGMPMVFAAFSGWLISLSDRYIMTLFLEKYEVANYILIYQLASNAFLVPVTFFMTIYFPKLLEVEKARGAEAVLLLNKRTTQRYLILSAPLLIAYYYLIPYLFGYIYTEYSMNKSVLLVVLLAQAIFMIVYFIGKKYELTNKTYVIAKAMFVAGLVNIGLNFYLIPLYGALGAAYATLCSSFMVIVCINLFGGNAVRKQ